MSDLTGHPAGEVEKVAAFMQRPIRSLEAVDAGRLLAEIALVADAYGARVELIPAIAKECTQLVQAKFRHLAIDEIREAYRQWASGGITVKGGEMYGGSFNAAQLGKVLTAYSEKRLAIASAISTEADRQREEEADMEREKMMRERFEVEFPKKFGEVRKTAKSWADVPGYFFRVLWRRGMISLTEDEIKEYFERAKEVAAGQLQEGRMKGHALAKIGTLEERAKVIAGKMVVWDRAISEEGFVLEGFGEKTTSA